MIKKISSIIVHTFRLIYLILSLPFKIFYIISKDKTEKSNRTKKEFNHSIKSNLIFVNQTELLEAGQLLFPNHQPGFEKFFNLFISDKKEFLTENRELLKDYKNFDLEKLQAIEIIYIFGDNKKLLWITDWRGEENEREIESFLQNKLQIKTDWTNVNKLRKEADSEKQRDGNLIIDLLKAIDKDLEPIHKKMIFLELGWDSYVYTVVDQTSFKTINDKFGKLFQGIEKLGNEE